MYNLDTRTPKSAGNPIKPLLESSKERALYDEILGPLVRPSRGSFKAEGLEGTTPRSSGDNNLIFLKRLEELEVECKQLRGTVAKLSHTNSTLESKNEELQSKLKASQNNEIANYDDLSLENTKLKEELEDIHKFLADYGLVWVGKSDEKTEPVLNESKAEELSVEDSFELYREIEKSINALNEQLKSEPTAVVVSGDNGARSGRLVHATERFKTVQVAFYLDGILVNRGPFRGFSSPSYHSFVSDILDGYLPKDFEGQFPDGVFLNLINKHNCLYQQRDGSVVVNGLNQAADSGPMSAKELLSRLPKKTVIKGKVMSIRDDVADLLGVSTPTTNTALEPKKPLFLQCPACSGSPALLQVKFACSPLLISLGICDDKGLTIHIQTSGDFSVKDLMTNIVRFLLGVNRKAKEGTEVKISPRYRDCSIADAQLVSAEECAKYKLELRLSYPSRLLNYEETVVSAGLVPNGSLNAKLILA